MFSPANKTNVTSPTGSWRRLGQRLYVRIWVAVVLAVTLLTLLVGWAWRMAAEPPLREVHVYNAQGQIIGSANRLPVPPPPSAFTAPGSGAGEVIGAPPPPPPSGPPASLESSAPAGPEFLVTLNDGQVLHIHLPRGPSHSPFGRRPYGFIWLLVLVGLAVALGTYPVLRRLTKSLEVLQVGVERWGLGDLSARVPTLGNDEVGHLAQRFNHAAAHIETLVEAHKSLLANASHELRSPLARIRMGLELLPAAQGSSAGQAEIRRNIAELDQLIDEILLASRLDARQSDIGTIESLDLTGLVAEECARYQVAFQSRHGESYADSDIGAASMPSVMVRGVDKLLRRVVRNLVENARRYSDGDISVSLQPEGESAVLRVCDQGSGVPAELRERIFEPFYRLPGASEQSGGVGLGLSLVKSIAGRMQGQARCEANSPRGACFVVELPLDRNSAAAPAPAQRAV